MTHEDAGHYAAKHAAGTRPVPGVEKAVRNKIVEFYSLSIRFLREDIGISGWDIEHAHPKHQMSGLRKLRELKAEFYADCPDSLAYTIEKKRYYITLNFQLWLESHYKD